MKLHKQRPETEGADYSSLYCLHVVTSQENETALRSAAISLPSILVSLLEGPPLHYTQGEKWLTFIFR